MINKSVFSLVYSAVNVVLPAFAAERRAAASCCGAVAAGHRYLLPSRGAQERTRRTPLLRSIDGTDGRTDGRTPDRYVAPAPHTMRAVPITRACF